MADIVCRCGDGLIEGATCATCNMLDRQEAREEGRREERADVVAWLRRNSVPSWNGIQPHVAIECGAHVGAAAKEEKP